MLRKQAEESIVIPKFSFEEILTEDSEFTQKELKVGQRVKIVKAHEDCIDDYPREYIGRVGILDSGEFKRDYDNPDTIVLNDEEAVFLRDFDVVPIFTN